MLRVASETLAAYDESVIEFPRADMLVFADESMRTTTLSLSQVTLLLDEAKRAYAEVYR